MSFMTRFYDWKLHKYNMDMIVFLTTSDVFLYKATNFWTI